MRRRILLLVLLFLLLPLPAHAATTLTIDPKTRIAAVSRQSVGLNTNYLMDGATNTLDGIAALNVGALRYPGGEKSDSYLWSVPPFTQSQPSLSRTGPNEWPSGDRTLVNADGSFVRPPLDFDQFMAIAQSRSAEPVLVVDFDSMFKPAEPGGTAPTPQDLLDSAVAWVRYASAHNYNVRYWELGNESYQGSFNGSPSAQQYAEQAVVFAQAMKAADPSIKIGVNGGNDAWWSTILPITSPYVDFLVVHNYPAYDWASYSAYSSKTTLMADVDRANLAIARFAQASDRSRLKIAITEYNALSWGGWGDANDIGHALVAFDILGQQLQYPQVMFSLFWNTRWISNDAGVKVFDALTPDNTVTPVGQSLALFSNYMHDSMVKASSNSTLRTFASYNTKTGALTVWVLNKKTSSQSASIKLSNYKASSKTVKQTVFRGTSSGDTQPTLKTLSSLSLSSNAVSLNAPAVSITILQFQGKVS